MRPSQMVILPILREKCRQWLNLGLPNLPNSCYVLLGRPQAIPAHTMNEYYDKYVKVVPAAERLQDLQRASARVIPPGSPSVRGSPAI